MNELVSLIIPSYNRAHLLREAIESTLLQTYPNWEMIIVDDKSTDDTHAVVSSYLERDTRISYYLNPDKGVSSARNFGIEKARGTYIAFLDDDDVNLPHRVESQLRAMLRSGAGFLVSGFQSRERKTGRLLEQYKLELKATCTGFPSRWMIRKDLLEKAGGFDQKAAPLEDIELSARLSQFENFTLHDDIVSITFQTEDSASKATEKMIKARIYLLEQAKRIFSPMEAAWWQYTVATDFYMLGKFDEAGNFLAQAVKGDARGLYRLAYIYYNLTKWLGGPFRRIHIKVLTILREFNLPRLVNHPVVSSENGG
jgi:glycosyltransferase involved in cell wall biosynthesis